MPLPTCRRLLPNLKLRSASRGELVDRFARTSKTRRRALSVVEPKTWTNPPSAPLSFSFTRGPAFTFYEYLKTVLYRRSWIFGRASEYVLWNGATLILWRSYIATIICVYLTVLWIMIEDKPHGSLQLKIINHQREICSLIHHPSIIFNCQSISQSIRSSVHQCTRPFIHLYYSV